MLEWIKNIRKKEKEELTLEQRELIEEYKKAVIKMRQARNAFENITEPEMIDACVYELNAARSHYSYLLSKIKEEKISVKI
jgi:hypothetical protein